jgi:hypothetical protein
LKETEADCKIHHYSMSESVYMSEVHRKAKKKKMDLGNIGERSALRN